MIGFYTALSAKQYRVHAMFLNTAETEVYLLEHNALIEASAAEVAQHGLKPGPYDTLHPAHRYSALCIGCGKTSGDDGPSNPTAFRNVRIVGPAAPILYLSDYGTALAWLRQHADTCDTKLPTH